MRNLLLRLKMADDGSDAYLNAFSVVRCEATNEGKNTKVFMRGDKDPTIVQESTEEILNQYLSWTSKLTREEILMINHK